VFHLGKTDGIIIGASFDSTHQNAIFSDSNGFAQIIRISNSFTIKQLNFLEMPIDFSDSSGLYAPKYSDTA